MCLTGHDRFARSDFEALRQFGIGTARECVRWHVIERVPGEYDFASLDSLLDVAEETEMQVVLDLLHFGWPDHIDIFSAQFPVSFGKFTAAVATHLRKRRPGHCYLIAPVNEISFLSWAGGEAACINPYRNDCAAELKRNLIRAAAMSSEILLNELPNVRLISPEPVIHIIENPEIPNSAVDAENYRLSQFQVWDMLSGNLAPELGGRPEYLDVIGTNFYDRNQWVHHGRNLLRDDPDYKPFREMLKEVWHRYGRPMFISETGTEDGWRAEWFTYVCDEVAAALDLGIPIEGICLYPILNHPGWEDDRHCHNGLLDYPDHEGVRNIHWPLAQAVRAQQRRFGRSSLATHEFYKHRLDLPISSPLGLRVSTTSTPDEQVRTNA
ncbi:MAG: beta-galactosidase [Acidobacteriota bacterium]|nr:beta-galactosidase [Acidobacteriota bacterium]MDQ2841415.1 beta-galactosidase [Acidobacteriota bacterium]